MNEEDAEGTRKVSMQYDLVMLPGVTMDMVHEASEKFNVKIVYRGEEKKELALRGGKEELGKVQKFIHEKLGERVKYLEEKASKRFSMDHSKGK